MKDFYNHPIAMETLFSKREVLQLLKLKGAFDSTLDFVRERYTDRFGLPLIWKVPISDDMRGGGTIVPVREGFLYLPYRTVYETQGAPIYFERFRTFGSGCPCKTDARSTGLSD